MSSNRQRLVNSIRRIALTPEERRQLLGDSANRGDQAGAGAKAASQGEESRICCDGSTAPPNAGSEERDPDASSQTGLDPDDPARLTSGDGTLSGVTDCATGQPICMDGNSFIPPDGWDDPYAPPADETYQEGEFLIRVGNFTCDFPQDGSQGPTVDSTMASNVTLLSFEELSPKSTPSGDRRRFSWEGKADTGQTVGGFICSDFCEGADAGADYCNPDPEDLIANQWPSDGCVNLAIKSGTIVGSKYDPDQSGAYNTPKTSIRLCDASNGTEILYQPLPGGGFRTIESSAGVAVSGAVGYTYSSDGSITGTITQAEWDATAP